MENSSDKFKKRIEEIKAKKEHRTGSISRTPQGVFVSLRTIGFILLGLVICTGAYFGINKYQYNVAQEKIKSAEQQRLAEVAGQERTAHDNELQEILSTQQAEIEKLKLQTAASTEQPKKEIVVQKPKPPITPPVVMKSNKDSIVAPAAVAPVINSTILNPAAQCLPTKQDWETFVSAYTNVQKEFNNFLDSYIELAFGTKNKPTEFIALVTYNYNHMKSEKERFTTSAANLRKLVDTLPRPITASNDDLQKIKDAYSNSTRDLEKSFDLALQSATVIAEDKDGVGTSDLTISQSLFKDSNTELYKVTPELDKAYAVENQFETQTFNDRSKGCLFTFYKDHTIATTIQAEWDFTKAKPSMVLSEDYPPSSAVVTLKTSLPVTLSSGAVMQLGCSEGAYRNVGQDSLSYKDIYSATRIDANTVSATVRPLSGRSFITRWCSFTYTGSGPLISSDSGNVRI